ncbi:MAG: NAD(+) diphosphatase [Desulfobacterales bacterium]
MTFASNGGSAVASGPEDLWILFREGKVLVTERDGRPEIPAGNTLGPLLTRITDATPLGSLNGRTCTAADLPEADGLPPGLAWCDLRGIITALHDDDAEAAGFGYQLVRWKRSSRFCGRCGERLEDHRHERSRFCPACGDTCYPRVFPAVIMAVTRGEELLLARAHRFRPAFFSVLAGYVEPGESLERCVRREVREEVGIELKNLRYFGSQSWPFSSALMVAFTAEYAAGELRADGREIAEAGWFRADRLPPVPGPPSIARRLIDDFIDRFSSRSGQTGPGPSHSPAGPFT